MFTNWAHNQKLWTICQLNQQFKPFIQYTQMQKQCALTYHLISPLFNATSHSCSLSLHRITTPGVQSSPTNNCKPILGCCAMTKLAWLTWNEQMNIRWSWIENASKQGLLKNFRKFIPVGGKFHSTDVWQMSCTTPYRHTRGFAAMYNNDAPLAIYEAHKQLEVQWTSTERQSIGFMAM